MNERFRPREVTPLGDFLFYVDIYEEFPYTETRRCDMNRRKIVISSGLLVVAILCVLFDCSFARWMCLLAMFCSFVGDMFLLDISWIRKRVNNYFVCGALAFGLAHICYGSAYYSLLDTKD